METRRILIKKVSTNPLFKLPKYESNGAAGMDLSADIDAEVELKPLERFLFPTGIAISLPKDLEAQIRPRSGLAAKQKISVLNTPGTIDADYRGEIKVILINHSRELFTVENGQRIAQMVICPIVQVQLEEVDVLSETKRGKDGFGSTGK